MKTKTFLSIYGNSNKLNYGKIHVVKTENKGVYIEVRCYNLTGPVHKIGATKKLYVKFTLTHTIAGYMIDGVHKTYKHGNIISKMYFNKDTGHYRTDTWNKQQELFILTKTITRTSLTKIVTKYRVNGDSCGDISSKAYLELTTSEYHNDDGPAKIEYIDGKIRVEHYYKYGMQHNDDGPATIKYHSNGTVESNLYYLNGAIDMSYYNGHTRAIEWHSNGEVRKIVHHENGELYHGTEPAVVCYTDKGLVEKESYYKKPSIGLTSLYNNTHSALGMGQLHNDDGPALIEYNTDSSISLIEYYNNGELHREDGPASCSYYYGYLSKEQYKIHGVFHRDEGPAEILYSYKHKTREAYYRHGKVHRVGGPALIEYNNDKVILKKYFDNDIVHRTDGAAIKYWDNTGALISKIYMYQGWINYSYKHPFTTYINGNVHKKLTVRDKVPQYKFVEYHKNRRLKYAAYFHPIHGCCDVDVVHHDKLYIDEDLNLDTSHKSPLTMYYSNGNVKFKVLTLNEDLSIETKSYFKDGVLHTHEKYPDREYMAWYAAISTILKHSARDVMVDEAVSCAVSSCKCSGPRINLEELLGFL